MISSITPPVFGNQQIVTSGDAFIFVPSFVFSANRLIKVVVTLRTFSSASSQVVDLNSVASGKTEISIGLSISTAYQIFFIFTIATLSTSAFSNRYDENTFAVSPTRVDISSSIISTYWLNFSRTRFTIYTFSLVSNFNFSLSCITFILISSTISTTNWSWIVILTSISYNSSICYSILGTLGIQRDQRDCYD